LFHKERQITQTNETPTQVESLNAHSMRSQSSIRSLLTLTTSGIFAFFLAQGVLLDRFPPFNPCANEFSLPFSYTKTLARPLNTTREKKRHLHKVLMMGNDLGGRPEAV
jgi:hypothetical protein